MARESKKDGSVVRIPTEYELEEIAARQLEISAMEYETHEDFMQAYRESTDPAAEALAQLIADPEYQRKCAEFGAAPSDGDVFAYNMERTAQEARHTDGSELNKQELRFCTFLRQGLTLEVAANAAGIPLSVARKIASSSEIVETANRQSAAIRNASLVITRDMLTLMFLEERERSGTASEGIAALREIGRLNALYPEQQLQRMAIMNEIRKQNGGGVTLDGSSEPVRASRSELSRKTDEELMELAGCQVHNTDHDRRQE